MDPKSSDGESPKSSDGESRDGFPSDLEVTDLMESPTGVTESLLGKRKAETPNSEDSTGDEEEEEEEEEDEEEEEEEENGLVHRDAGGSETEPEWGYDSFDSCQDDDPCDQRMESDDELEEKWRHYLRQVNETKGFFKVTDKFPGRVYSGIGPLRDLDKPTSKGVTGRQLCEMMTGLCLDRYNHDESKNVKLSHIIRVNWTAGSLSKFYMTIAARESESLDAPLVEYQTKAAHTVDNKSYPILCRPSPPYPIFCGPCPQVKTVMEKI